MVSPHDYEPFSPLVRGERGHGQRDMADDSDARRPLVGQLSKRRVPSELTVLR